MRRLVLLGALLSVGQAQSQKLASNLEMLDPLELCGPYVIVTMNDKQDWETSITLTKSVRDAGAKSLAIDTFAESDLCTYSITINVFAAKTNLEPIIYMMELNLQVEEAGFKDIFGEQHTAKEVVIYSNDYFGISTNLNTFNSSLNSNVLLLWKAFADDWNSVKHYHN